MAEISWEDFTKVELRGGKVLEAQIFEEARKPAYLLRVDFRGEFGVLKSSAQVTDLYTPDELVGRLVVGVVHFPKIQIGSHMSECLITGFYSSDAAVALCVPDKEVPIGAKLC